MSIILNIFIQRIKHSKNYKITVLGDKIEGIDIDEAHQLHTCPTHKKYVTNPSLKLTTKLFFFLM